MMMYEQTYERRGSISDLSNGSIAAEYNHQASDLVGRLSDLSMKSLSNVHGHVLHGGVVSGYQTRRRYSAKFSYESDASVGSEMSLKSTTLRSRAATRRFSHTGSLGGHSYGRASPVGLNKTLRRMSEMSIAEYSNSSELEDKGNHITPPQTIYTIKEDNESDTNSVDGRSSVLGGRMPKSFSQHSFTQAYGTIGENDNDGDVQKKKTGMAFGQNSVNVGVPSESSFGQSASFSTGSIHDSRSFVLGHHNLGGSTTDVFPKFNHSADSSNLQTIFRREVAFVDNEDVKPSFTTGLPSASQSRRRGWKSANRQMKQSQYLENLNLEEDDEVRLDSADADRENAEAPVFIQDELVGYNGRGPYGPLEQLIILLYGYQFFYSKNVYSIVSRKMNYKRNRASVRQKLEQIVHKASGQQYGSLLNRREEVLPILRKEFWRILYACEASTPHDQAFASEIKKLAHEINMPEQAT